MPTPKFPLPVLIGFVGTLLVLGGVLVASRLNAPEPPRAFYGTWQLALLADASGRLIPVDDGPIVHLRPDGVLTEGTDSTQARTFRFTPTADSLWLLTVEDDTTAYLTRLFGDDQLELAVPGPSGYAQTFVRVTQSTP